MRRALNEYRIGGIKTSIPFHQEIMNSAEFHWGTFDTGFLDQRKLGQRVMRRPDYQRVAAVAAALIANEEGRQAVHIGNEEGATGQESIWKRAGRIRSTGGRL